MSFLYAWFAKQDKEIDENRRRQPMTRCPDCGEEYSEDERWRLCPHKTLDEDPNFDQAESTKRSGSVSNSGSLASGGAS